MKEKYLKSLSFELTRRCNMKCEFCCKGDSQNIDITPEIIDKTLQEFKDFNIVSLRINGGEPLLNKQGLIYLIDEIIRIDFKIYECFMFTNGTIKDNEIKQALIKLGNHCKKCADSDWGKKILIHKSNTYEPLYNINSYVSIIISTDFHDNRNIIKDTIKFYNHGVNSDILIAVNQTNSVINNNINRAIVLQGNAKDNLSELSQKGHNIYELFNNKYSLISSDIDMNIIIDKTLNICVNGNVTAGCSQSYFVADTDFLCNILNCKGDIYNYIDKYSWEYPLSRQQAKFFNGIATQLYLYDKGISYFSNGLNKPLCEKLIFLMNNFVELLKLTHKKYIKLNHEEANILATLNFITECDSDDSKNLFLDILLGENFTDEEIEQCKNLLLQRNMNKLFLA